MKRSAVYLYSRQDLANIIADQTKALAEAQSLDGSAWWKDNSVLVYSASLSIWIDRLANYDSYAAAIRQDADKLGLTVREGE